MNEDLKLVLREILSQMESSGEATPNLQVLREKLREKGVSENLIADAMFLMDVIGDVAAGRPAAPTRPTRVLSEVERQGLNPSVVGKLFRLYYLGYLKKEDMESVMTNLLFVPLDIQDMRARECAMSLLGMTAGQVDFIFDGGGPDSAVVH